MEHKSLTAEITSKAKKHHQNFEHTFFSQIPYQNVTEINYLRDLEEKKQSLDFPIFQFQKDFGEEALANDFDMLANTLYKKIMQQGYIQQKKAPSKKKKKTKNPLEYDYEDEWINDEEAMTVKKNIYVKVENFKCFSQGIEDFYNSELYKSSLSQIQQQSKKKTNEITMDAHQLEEIKKKIKENISMAHNRAKEELYAEKPTMITENHVGNEGNVEGNSNQDQANLIKTQNCKGQDAQSVSGQLSESKDNDSGPKLSSKSSKNQNPEDKLKKAKKVPPKTKPVKKTSRSEKRQKGKSSIQEDEKGVEEKVVDLGQMNRKESESINSSKEQNIGATTNGLEGLRIEDKQKVEGNQQMIEECHQ